MAKQSTWQNADGLAQRYGKHTADNDTAKVYSGENGAQVLEIEIDCIQLSEEANIELGTAGPTSTKNIYAGGYHSNGAKIPAGSCINRVHGLVTEALVATSGTPLPVLGTYTMGADGLYNADDKDSLLDATDYAITFLDAVGNSFDFRRGRYNASGFSDWYTTAALLVKDGTITTDDFYVLPALDTSDTFSAGKIKVTVEYMLPA